MTIGIELGSITDEIGTADFFKAFFSTISGNLEPEGQGSRFPVIMKKLYMGELPDHDALTAITELKTIQQELSRLGPDDVIWDIEDRKKMPPWGKNISTEITNLSNYFITSTGRDLISSLYEIFEELRDRGGVAKVVVI
jgi:2,3-bisphosphoglycerate-dependent phosphoglycerate mutase